MNTHDFIFSNSRTWWLKRHTSFWFLWWWYFILTFFVPDHQFPNWVIISKPLQNGISIWVLKVFLQSLSLMSSIVLFTYVINYFLLPRFFLKGRYLSFGAGILAALICIFFLTWLEYLYYNRQIGILLSGWANPLTFNYIINCTFNFMLFNLPPVAGVAVLIKVLKRWYLKQEETEQIAKEKVKAELQLLKARIHPHFLFNSLNNIYAFALETSPKTPEMIQKLSGLLHYMLNDCNQPKVELEKELMMLRNYISLERIRYGEKLDLNIELPFNNAGKLIAPLLLIPFVENAFKHGTSKMLAHPRVNLHILVTEDILYLKLVNNKPLVKEEMTGSTNHGLGLENVKKRLLLLYPNRHELQIAEEPGIYTVRMKIILADDPPISRKKSFNKKQAVYEMASPDFF